MIVMLAYKIMIFHDSIGRHVLSHGTAGFMTHNYAFVRPLVHLNTSFKLYLELTVWFRSSETLLSDFSELP